MAGSGFRSTLSFGGQHVDIGEESTVASLGWHPRYDVDFELSAGAILDGTLSANGIDHDVAPGVSFELTASWLALPETPSRPFIMLSFTAGASTTHTNDPGDPALTAVDFRIGALVGKTFFDRLTPYAAVRLFGGPVYWTLDGASVTGTDTHHYAVGAGTTLRLPHAVDLFAEIIPLGERSLTIGAGLTF